MLSTIATTTTDNFIQAVKQLKTTSQTLTYQTQMWSLKFTLAQAQLAYANAIAGDQTVIGTWNQSVQANATDSLIQTLAPYFRDASGNFIPNITTFASLLKAEGMYDPNNVPIIQLNQLTSTNPATIAALLTVSQQGISLYLPRVVWQGITL